MIGVPERVIGVTGHQSLSAATRQSVGRYLLHFLRFNAPTRGLTSLAAGTDQIFARCVLRLGGNISAVIPSDRYESTFSGPKAIHEFRELLSQATEVIRLPYAEPSEEAFWSAGKEIVDRCSVLIAVWDGKPAGGLGGTADVVAYARDHGRPVDVVWPPSASRQ